MKLFTAFIIAALTSLAYAQEPPEAFDISAGDPWKVQIELSQTDSPQLNILFSGHNLAIMRKFMNRNHDKLVNIQINGKVVSSPVIKLDIPYRGTSISIPFSDTESAIKTAKYLMKTK